MKLFKREWSITLPFSMDVSLRVLVPSMSLIAFFGGAFYLQLKTRSNFDGFRNSVSHIAQHYFTSKELHAKSCYTQYEMVRDLKCVEMFEEYWVVFNSLDMAQT
jgi:hypothetical protein